MKKLLFIDDDTTLQKLYQDSFAGTDYSLSVASSGKEGLDRIMKDPPDLILLDVMLSGGMNGFDVAEQLKKDPKTAHIPFIFMTNLDSERKSAMETGAADYIIKADTTMTDVLEKINRILNVPSA